MRYIEGLSSDSNSMCDWRRELSSTQDLFAPSPLSLDDAIPFPVWLDKLMASESESSINTVDTIFALRDFMLQEALSVVKFA